MPAKTLEAGREASRRSYERHREKKLKAVARYRKENQTVINAKRRAQRRLVAAHSEEFKRLLAEELRQPSTRPYRKLDAGKGRARKATSHEEVGRENRKGRA